jgi:hypothetical protein
MDGKVYYRSKPEDLPSGKKFIQSFRVKSRNVNPSGFIFPFLGHKTTL